MTDLPAIPSDEEIAREPDDTRRAVLAAMQRILTGAPRTVRPGSDSVLQLAVEAGVGRHQLYRSGADLRLRFERAKAISNRPTTSEARLQLKLDDAKTEIERLSKLQKETRDESDSWKGLVHLLHRAVNVLQEELRKEQIKTSRLVKKLERAEGDSRTNPVIPIRPPRDL